MPVCHYPRAGWLLTDARLAGHGLAAARRLPPGSVIIVRSDGLTPNARRILTVRLKRIAQARRLRLFVAAIPVDQARRLGVDGIHLRTRSADEARIARRHGLATSAPVHSRTEARAAAKAGIDHALISPLFDTRSHPGSHPMTQRQFISFALMARANPVALGGMTPARSRKLHLRCAPSGMRPDWAAIDAWENQRQAQRQKRNCVPT
jgi:thiamine-phosphate pyrophosphorylase